jgi:hypothetical protein
MNLDFGTVLARAWKITWDNKVLWIFGILAGLGSGGFNYNSNFSNVMRNGPGGQPNLPPRLEQFIERVGPGLLFAIVGGVICLSLIIGLIIFALSVIGRGGLIGGAQIAEANGKVTFGEAWATSRQHFLNLFLIGLLVFSVTFVLALVIIAPGLLLTVTVIGAICGLPLICVGFLLTAALSILAYFAQIAVVVEQRSLGSAFTRAWEVIRANFGPLIILGIIIFVVRLVINSILAIPIFLLVGPMMLAAFGFATERQGLGAAGLAITGVCLVAYLPVLFVISGILQTWITSVFTLAYQQVTRPSAPLGSMPAPTIVHPQ